MIFEGGSSGLQRITFFVCSLGTAGAGAGGRRGLASNSEGVDSDLSSAALIPLVPGWSLEGRSKGLLVGFCCSSLGHSLSLFGGGECWTGIRDLHPVVFACFHSEAEVNKK